MDDLQVHQPALTFYIVSKKEMLLRIREREIATYVWMGVLGTILTIAFNRKSLNFDVLLIIPLLAAGISMRISQHETIIAKLAQYCKKEIGPFLKKGQPPELRHWDESEALKGQKTIVGLRNIINSILFVGPCLFSIILNYNDFFNNGATSYKFVWVTSLFLTVLTIYFMIKSLSDRLNAALVKIREERKTTGSGRKRR